MVTHKLAASQRQSWLLLRLRREEKMELAGDGEDATLMEADSPADCLMSIKGAARQAKTILSLNAAAIDMKKNVHLSICSHSLLQEPTPDHMSISNTH